MLLTPFQLFYKWILIMLSGTKSIHIFFILFSFTFYWSSSCRYPANVAISKIIFGILKIKQSYFFKVKITQNLFDFDLDEIRTANDKLLGLVIK